MLWAGPAEMPTASNFGIQAATLSWRRCAELADEFGAMFDAAGVAGVVAGAEVFELDHIGTHFAQDQRGVEAGDAV